jgi:hypothetical protein
LLLVHPETPDDGNIGDFEKLRRLATYSTDADEAHGPADITCVANTCLVAASTSSNFVPATTQLPVLADPVNPLSENKRVGSPGLVTRTCAFATFERQSSLATTGWSGAHPSTLAGCTVSVAAPSDAPVAGGAISDGAAGALVAVLEAGCCPL